MSEPITIRKLVKRFGTVTAVDRVDINVPAGSLFFLLGPSGCGKTTLLRMLAGFTDPTAGSIHFADHNVTHLSANRRNCGMVFQSYALWPHMTVAENVAFGLNVRKVAGEARKRRVEAALDRVQMLPYAQRKPNELSGGQQQRVALARAMVIEPTVLLLDEPLSNLDAKLRLEMRSTIKRVCNDADITAVYVTHDQKEALSMADHVAVLNEGRVQQIGTPRDVYDRPANRFVADFLGETNFLPAKISGRDGDKIELESSAGKLLSTACPDDVRDGQVTCSIRPEAVRLMRTDGNDKPAANCFDAMRIETVYLGEMAQHQFALGEKLIFKVFELNPRSDADDRTLRIVFDPQDVVVLGPES